MGNDPVRFSISLFGIPLDHYGPLAVAAETAGYDAVWLADHLVAPVTRSTPYPYSPTGGPGFDHRTPIVDVWVAAGLIAGATSRLRIGTGVYILPLRPAVVSARAAATVQALSGGRLLFGVGTGWLAEEFSATDTAFAGRGVRTDEMIGTMRRLWTGDPVGLSAGDPDVVLAPPVVPPIPIVIGGSTRPALSRAARLGDGWYGPPCSLEESIAARRAMDALRSSDRPFTYFARLPAPYRAGTVDEYREAGFADIVVTLAGCGCPATAPLTQQVDAIQAALLAFTG